MIINGFVVVRLPHLNYLVPGRDVIPCIDGLYYAGVDRQRWIDLFDEDYYAKRLPSKMVREASILKTSENDFSASPFAKSSPWLLNCSNTAIEKR
jgi:hypothetical protein